MITPLPANSAGFLARLRTLLSRFGATLASLTVSGAASVAGTLTMTGDMVPLFSSASGDGAITQKSGTVYITKGSAAVLTIANPTSGTDDGKTLTILSTTAFAHTVSNAAGAGFNGGGAATDVGTYGAAKGNNMVIEAMTGVWYVVSSVGVTLG